MARGLARAARQRSSSAGPWETAGFGIMGAYGLNKLDELEQWSKAKFKAEMTKKLERNRARARRPPPARTRCSHLLRRRVTTDLAPISWTGRDGRYVPGRAGRQLLEVVRPKDGLTSVFYCVCVCCGQNTNTLCGVWRAHVLSVQAKQHFLTRAMCVHRRCGRCIFIKQAPTHPDSLRGFRLRRAPCSIPPAACSF